MHRIDRFRFDRECLQLTWNDGADSEFLALWLRDHCQMPQSRNPANGQRLLNITDIAADIGIDNALLADGQLHVEFSDGHRSIFEPEWLRANCYTLNRQHDDRSETAKQLWDAGAFAQGIPRCAYDRFESDAESRLQALRAVRDFGFVVQNKILA